MSTARERVGPSAAFGQAAPPRSIRGQLIDSLVGSAPTEVSPDRVTHNPGNPREVLDEGYIAALGANMGQVGQVQPATVMTRLAFLVAHPEHQHDVPADAEYVVLDGHCRLAAARSAGLPTLKITVDDSSAGTPEDILAAALSANHFRKDLTYMEEARALEALIAHHGSAAAVAELLGGRMNSGWISQRRALLALPQDVQERVDAGEIPLEIARTAGRKDPEEQRAFIEARLSERHAAQAGKARAKRGRAAAAERRAAEAADREPGEFYGVSSGAGTRSVPVPVEFYGVSNGGADDGDPEPEEFYGVSSAERVPWSDGHQVADLVLARMGEAQREVLLRRLTEARAVSRPE